VRWPPEPEAADWRAIPPHREAVRRWIEAAKDGRAGLRGVIDLREADRDESYGAVLDVFRGVVDAGVPLTFSFTP